MCRGIPIKTSYLSRSLLNFRWTASGRTCLYLVCVCVFEFAICLWMMGWFRGGVGMGLLCLFIM
jgi:hypothetical protein